MTTALVTGGLKRLGGAMAVALAKAGCDIVVHHRSGDAAEQLQQLRSLGVTAAAIQADLDDPDAAAALIPAAAQAIGAPIDVLVNSAARFTWDDAKTATADRMAAHFRTNTIAPVLLTQALAAQSDVQHGLVVNMLDQKLINPNPDHLSYTLAKAALASFTQLAAMAFAPRIRVNAIAPGYILPAPGQSAADFARLHGQSRLGRGADSSDIAQALVYLLQAKAVTGTLLPVDAGDHLGPDVRDYSFR